MSGKDFMELRAMVEREADHYPQSSEPEVGEFLCALCRMISAKRVLEVGVWKGYTHLWLLEGVDGGEVVGIDIQDHRSDCVKGLNGSTFMLGDSREVIPQLATEGFDMAFLDSDHSYEHTLKELELLIPKILPGGVVCCHDAMSFKEVSWAVRDVSLFARFDSITLPTPFHPERWHQISGLAILRKL